MPEPKSMRELPSTSTITPPPAAATNTGSTLAHPAGHGALAPGEQVAGRGPGYLGDEAALLRKPRSGRR